VAGLRAHSQPHAVKSDAVIGGATVRSSSSQRTLVEIDNAQEHEGRLRIRRRPREGGVVVRDEVVSQIAW
jgi:hypothetical protein